MFNHLTYAGEKEKTLTQGVSNADSASFCEFIWITDPQKTDLEYLKNAESEHLIG